MNKTTLIIIGILCALLSVVVITDCSSQAPVTGKPSANNPLMYIKMELIPTNPVVGNDINLKMLVKNISETPIKIIRLPFRRYEETGGWGGWSVEIEGPGGKYSPIPFPKIQPPVLSADIIELKHGESFDLTLNLNYAVLHGGHVSYPTPHINEKAGNYSARIIYDASDKNMFSFHEEIPKDLFPGPILSDTLKFTVKSK